MTIKLYNHQEKFVSWSDSVNYSVLGDEQGLGKTFTTLAVAKKNGLSPLIVCPAYLKSNWQKEADILGVKVTIVSYSMLKKVTGSFGMIIADETHYLKNMSAQRTKYFHKLVKIAKPERLILASGTPLQNHASEWWSLLLLMSYDPSLSNGLNVTYFYPTEWKFNTMFCRKKTLRIRGRQITQFYGHQNLDSLKTLLKGKYVRRLAKNVLDLPEFREVDLWMTEKDDPEMELAWAQFEAGRKYEPQSKAKSALLKASFTAKFVLDTMAQDGGPLVVYSDHLASIHHINKAVSTEAKAALIDGSTPMHVRQEIVEKFQAGEIDVLCATIGALSTGVTLTRASKMVFNDFSWIPANNSQAKKRIHRIGQKNECIYYYVLRGKIDKLILKNLSGKEKTLAKAM